MHKAMVSTLDLKQFDDEQLRQLAGIAEGAERHEDMCMFLKELTLRAMKEGKIPGPHERNHLSVAYKNVVGFKRKSWRSLVPPEESTEDETLTLYRRIVEDELKAVCQEVLEILDGICKLCEEQSTDDESNGQDSFNEMQVFYRKMKGDYLRYLAELPEMEAEGTKAGEAYEEAQKWAENLPATHPTRLGLALNHSVCRYEILQEKDAACTLAKQAFDNAIEKLDSLNDVSYKDSTLIMQLLRDNLTLWTEAEPDAGEE